jgi:hypothetical protein
MVGSGKFKGEIQAENRLTISMFLRLTLKRILETISLKPLISKNFSFSL